MTALPGIEVTHDLGLTRSVSYEDFVDAVFLRTALGEGLTAMRGDGWITRSSLDDVPGEVVARADYFQGAQDEVLVRIGDGLAHAILRERSLSLRVAALCGYDASAIRRRVREALPEVADDDREVPARFWWWQPHAPRDLARMLPAPSWESVAHNYVESTRASVTEIAAWREAPPPGGRLMLWHGQPGTGKTHAIRALAGEWRSWAEFQFVTDPEEFLSNPSYLLNTIADSRRSSARAKLWRIVVLKDAGEYLAPDAKHTRGQALSRLLNVCDGVLGQAMRALVLVTTNEPMRTLHPALSRLPASIWSRSVEPEPAMSASRMRRSVLGGQLRPQEVRDASRPSRRRRDRCSRRSRHTLRRRRARVRAVGVARCRGSARLRRDPPTVAGRSGDEDHARASDGTPWRATRRS